MKLKLMVIVMAWIGAVAMAGDTIKVLLIDGQNNHGAMKKTTPMIKTILENTGRFIVTHSQTPPSDGKRPNYSKPQPTVADMPPELQAQWAKWNPDFSQYDVVISNYNGVLWPDAVRARFESYMKNGGGLVTIHAADNSFAQWNEYNRMIGVGGWYGRNEKNGPRIYWQKGKLIRDNSPGRAGMHGKRKPVLVFNQAPNHPITKGLPASWLHPDDEVYCNMRGPAENITVLATANSDKKTGGSGLEQPIVLALTYGKGRIYHDMLGHDENDVLGLGYQIMLIRGTEWAATGKVTYPAVDAKKLSPQKVVTREPNQIQPIKP